MTQLTTAQKRARDWSDQDVLRALYAAGWSFRRLALHHGVSPSTLRRALHQPYPRGEERIASALGIAPQQIWPSRYDSEGRPNRVMGRPRFVPTVIPNLRPRKPATATSDDTPATPAGNG